VQGEDVKKLDIFANNQFLGVLRHGISCGGLASEELDDIVLFFAPFSACEFFIYGKVPQSRDEEHLHFREYSRAGFLDDLRECNGVVCKAGFELPGEALHLGKKLLLRPLEHSALRCMMLYPSALHLWVPPWSGSKIELFRREIPTKKPT
jgi:hypothetical protein